MYFSDGVCIGQGAGCDFLSVTWRNKFRLLEHVARTASVEPRHGALSFGGQDAENANLSSWAFQGFKPLVPYFTELNVQIKSLGISLLVSEDRRKAIRKGSLPAHAMTGQIQTEASVPHAYGRHLRPKYGAMAALLTEFCRT